MEKYVGNVCEKCGWCVGKWEEIVMWRSNEKLNSGFEYFGGEKLEFKISHYGGANDFEGFQSIN